MAKRVYGTPGRPPPSLPSTVTDDPRVVAEARKIVRRLMLAMRWDDQGGYSSLYNGKWSFISTSLPQTLTAELDALMKFAGVVPDEIQPKGDCKDCEHAENGRERGYVRPCLDCKRPYHSNFVPLKRVAKKRKAVA